MRTSIHHIISYPWLGKSEGKPSLNYLKEPLMIRVTAQGRGRGRRSSRPTTTTGLNALGKKVGGSGLSRPAHSYSALDVHEIPLACTAAPQMSYHKDCPLVILVDKLRPSERVPVVLVDLVGERSKGVLQTAGTTEDTVLVALSGGVELAGRASGA